MDDIVSIESVKSLDQLSFWCLTISTMLSQLLFPIPSILPIIPPEFIAMGVTIAVMPFNEWIQLKRSGTQMAIVVSHPSPLPSRPFPSPSLYKYFFIPSSSARHFRQ
jgi:hypothetical protein